MKIGFIGVGAMGSGMVTNLLKHPLEVVVLDTDQEKVNQMVSLGATSAITLQEVALQSEVIILCLSHPDISREVLFGEKGIVKGTIKGKTVIETSTLTPEITQEFFEKLKALDSNYLCAPMLAGSIKAHAGNIHFLIEGEKSIAEKYKDIFLAMGNKITYLGQPPQATLAKLARNICRYANVAAAIEVINFLKSYTTDIKSIYDVLVDESHTNFDEVWSGAIKPVALENKSYQASQISVKDLGLILDRSQKKSVAMPVTKTTLEVHEKHLRV